MPEGASGEQPSAGEVEALRAAVEVADQREGELVRGLTPPRSRRSPQALAGRGVTATTLAFDQEGPHGARVSPRLKQHPVGCRLAPRVRQRGRPSASRPRPYIARATLRDEAAPGIDGYAAARRPQEEPAAAIRRRRRASGGSPARPLRGAETRATRRAATRAEVEAHGNARAASGQDAPGRDRSTKSLQGAERGLTIQKVISPRRVSGTTPRRGRFSPDNDGRCPAGRTRRRPTGRGRERAPDSRRRGRARGTAKGPTLHVVGPACSRKRPRPAWRAEGSR